MNDSTSRQNEQASQPSPPPGGWLRLGKIEPETHRIVILGGGFGGVYAALRLAQNLGSHSRSGPVNWGGENYSKFEILLVSRDNFFLMTPLLFEAGSGILEPRHAVAPIRTLVRRYRQINFVNAEITAVDFDRRIVSARPAGIESIERYDIPYHQIVIALGGTTNLKMIEGSENAFTFKSLADAIFLRNYIIDLFERAEVEHDPKRKRAMLRFVVVGGGLVATELVGELSEFLLNLSRVYPHIDPINDVALEMFEATSRIMGEMPQPLADYSVRQLRSRGVKIHTDAPVQKISPGLVELKDSTRIECDTIILAAGVSPSPLVAGLPLEKDKKGRVIVEATLRNATRPEVWALGDCAFIPDPDGKPYPQLAQHALRESRVLAENIVAALRGQPLKPFIYHTIGMLAALGHYKGVGSIWKIHIRGFIAWWVWRTYYLMQMPRWSRRVRVILDWTTALLFKNDIVKLDLFGKPHPAGQYEQKMQANEDAHAAREEKV